MDNTNNKEFWNNYVSYWENKVEEANSDAKAKDKTVDDMLLKDYFLKLEVLPEENFLDYGCGSGRCYPIYKQSFEGNANGYFGIDISSVSLEHCAGKYPKLKIGERLIEFDGVHIPFDDNYFERILCWGVFDACCQERTMQELMRVLKINGKLLLTGKNNNYYEDDEAALTAEINACKKNHPNYFTDVYGLTNQLLEHNARLLKAYYFLRRGDFAKNQAVEKMPEKFYEWAYLVEKTEKYKDIEYRKFSDKYSKLFIKT